MDVLQTVASINDPDATLPSEQQRGRIPGTPLGHPEFSVPRWWVCLKNIAFFCIAAVLVRLVHPALTVSFAGHHDAIFRRCLNSFLEVALANISWDLASLPMSLGGLASKTSHCSPDPLWSSWADCLDMRIVDLSFHLAGVCPTSWEELAAESAPNTCSGMRTWNLASPTWVAAKSHKSCPWLFVQIARWSRLSKMDSSLFRLLLLRRLWLLPPSLLALLPVWPSTGPK